jgi:YD repeat-containing protein
VVLELAKRICGVEPRRLVSVFTQSKRPNYTYDSNGHLIAVDSSGNTVYSNDESSPLPGVPYNDNPR